MEEKEAGQQLTWPQQRVMDDAYEKGKRKLELAYFWAVLPLLLFGVGVAFRWVTMFFGLLGIHRFYLGRYKTAILMLCLWQGGFLSLTFVSIFFGESIGQIVTMLLSAPMMLAGFIWFLVDLFLIPRMVRRYNAQLADKLRKNFAEESAS